MSTDRIDRLRALKRGMPEDIGAGAPALRRKIEADEQGREADLNQEDETELRRLLAILEVGFLAAAGDGELGEREVVNLGGNFSHWIGQDLDEEAIGTMLDGFSTALEEQGLEARLALIAETLDNIIAADYPADRRHILLISDCSTDGTDEIVGE